LHPEDRAREEAVSLHPEDRAREEAVSSRSDERARLPFTLRSKVKGKEAVRVQSEDRSLTVAARTFHPSWTTAGQQLRRADPADA
jgi:hypothetical protein